MKLFARVAFGAVVCASVPSFAQTGSSETPEKPAELPPVQVTTQAPKPAKAKKAAKAVQTPSVAAAPVTAEPEVLTERKPKEGEEAAADDKKAAGGKRPEKAEKDK